MTIHPRFQNTVSIKFFIHEINSKKNWYQNTALCLLLKTMSNSSIVQDGNDVKELKTFVLTRELTD